MQIDSKSSFYNFIYPFQFDHTQFKSLADGIDRKEWPGKKRKLEVWETLDFPSEELLSHIADFLNPPEGRSPTARLWQMGHAAMESLDGLGANAEWILATPGGNIAFKILSVQLTLFKVGVGFLTLEIEPFSDGDNFGDWLNLLHYFRFSRGQRRVSLSLRKSAYDQETKQRTMEAYFPEPAGGLNEHPDGTGSMNDLIESMLVTPQLAETWWHEVFIPGQLMPYAVLNIDEIEEDKIPQTIYRIRNFFHDQQPLFPAAEDLSIEHDSLLHYTKNQWFFFSLDGGGFVSFNAPQTEFFRISLPDHLKKQYFLLFILALQQRFVLMSLESEVAVQWQMDLGSENDEGQMRIREEAFGNTQNLLLTFTARGYFVQVMQREHHHRCYRKWQEIFQVDQLLIDVNNEVRYMHNYLQTQHEIERQKAETERLKQREAFQRRINLIAWFVGLPILLLSFLNVIGEKRLGIAVVTMVGSLAIGLVAYFTINYLTGRKPKG